MTREEASREELIALSDGVPDEGLNEDQKVLIGKFVLWLRSFQCPDSFQVDTAYGMMKDVWSDLT